MTAPRIFLSYAFVDTTHRDYQFAMRLVNDLRTAGAEVFVDEVSSAENNLAATGWFWFRHLRRCVQHEFS